MRAARCGFGTWPRGWRRPRRDLVVTSGHRRCLSARDSDRRVRAIDDRGAALFHYAMLTPVVDFARVDEVLILTDDTRHDVATAFPTDG